MKILITNQHTANYGDDAAGVGLALQLRDQFPEAELHFVYSCLRKGVFLSIPYVDDKTFHHSELTITNQDLLNTIKYFAKKIIPLIKLNCGKIDEYVNLIKETDLVIISPSGANIGIYKDWKFLLKVLVPVLEGYEPVFHLNTIGKSGHIVFDILAKYVLKRSKIFVRDSKSYQELKEWGMCCSLGVDTAFSLPINTHKISSTINNNVQEYIAFIPTKIGEWHPFFSEIKPYDKISQSIVPSLAEFAQIHQMPIIIIPHLYGSSSEEKLLFDIQNQFFTCGLNSHQVSIVNNLISFYDYEKYIIHSNLVVSMRYHGIVFAIKNAVPFVSLAYDNKMKEACDYSGVSDCNIDLRRSDFCQADLLEVYKSVYSRRQSIVSKLESKRVILDNLSKLPLLTLSLYSDHK